MTLRIRYDTKPGEFAEAMKDLYRDHESAASLAIEEAAAGIKAEGRAQIRAGGFSPRFATALRVDVYPARGKVSGNAAAHIYHQVPHAEVFEEGATILGQPLLWLPLPNVPQRLFGLPGKPMTPENFNQEIGDLESVNRPGRAPLLVAPAALSRAEARKRRPKVSLDALVRGAERKGPRSIRRRVPVFVGVPKVRIGKKFDIYGVIARWHGRLAGLYERNLRD